MVLYHCCLVCGFNRSVNSISKDCFNNHKVCYQCQQQADLDGDKQLTTAAASPPLLCFFTGCSCEWYGPCHDCERVVDEQRHGSIVPDYPLFCQKHIEHADHAGANIQQQEEVVHVKKKNKKQREEGKEGRNDKKQPCKGFDICGEYVCEGSENTYCVTCSAFDVVASPTTDDDVDAVPSSATTIEPSTTSVPAVAATTSTTSISTEVTHHLSPRATVSVSTGARKQLRDQMTLAHQQEETLNNVADINKTDHTWDIEYTDSMGLQHWHEYQVDTPVPIMTVPNLVAKFSWNCKQYPTKAGEVIINSIYHNENDVDDVDKRSFKVHKFPMSNGVAKGSQFCNEVNPQFAIPIMYGWWSSSSVLISAGKKKQEKVIIANCGAVHPCFPRGSLAVVCVMLSTCDNPINGVILCNLHALNKQEISSCFLELRYTTDSAFLKGLYCDPSIKFNKKEMQDAFMINITNSRRLYDPKRGIRLDASPSVYNAKGDATVPGYSFKGTDEALNRWYLSEDDAKAGYEIR